MATGGGKKIHAVINTHVFDTICTLSPDCRRDVNGVYSRCVNQIILLSKGQYKYAQHNDVSVNDAPHIRRRSHNIIISL